MGIDFNSIVDIFKKCKEYTKIIERLDKLEENVRILQLQVNNNDKARICPHCHNPTLDIDYVERECLASFNTITRQKQYGTIKVFVAKCSSCGWECDDQNFINHRLNI